jgi:hypothetical protein
VALWSHVKPWFEEQQRRWFEEQQRREPERFAEPPQRNFGKSGVTYSELFRDEKRVEWYARRSGQ